MDVGLCQILLEEVEVEKLINKRKEDRKGKECLYFCDLRSNVKQEFKHCDKLIILLIFNSLLGLFIYLMINVY